MCGGDLRVTGLLKRIEKLSAEEYTDRLQDRPPRFRRGRLSREDIIMNLQEIRHIARAHGLKPGKRNKVSLIKDIQIAEGNFDCFATATEGVCDQAECIWREDCFAVATRGVTSN